MDTPTSLEPTPTPNIPSIIQRYLNGESIQHLARESAVSRQTLYNWMLAETGPEYERMITQALVNRIADADSKLEESASVLDITRARELARFSRMDFERRRPKLYGPKQEITEDKTIRVIIEDHVTQPVVDVTPHNSGQSVSVQELKDNSE